ncbi:uncharacterized protein B0T15DRAFT_517693 [Chaetomium strumarium]|uniref:Secreted protein n=1 Tax=Chaetomium strumarium TaxID=1170767 RepID=A0AAJ0H1M9_9PEZI|nr:hypothetical protein B0T15DRAFT_517693 [Chaetomium strumarium]
MMLSLVVSLLGIKEGYCEGSGFRTHVDLCSVPRDEGSWAAVKAPVSLHIDDDTGWLSRPTVSPLYHNRKWGTARFGVFSGVASCCAPVSSDSSALYLKASQVGQDASTDMAEMSVTEGISDG